MDETVLRANRQSSFSKISFKTTCFIILITNIPPFMFYNHQITKVIATTSRLKYQEEQHLDVPWYFKEFPKTQHQHSREKKRWVW
jgi:hypothetical protein